jgi:hypothetical protein
MESASTGSVSTGTATSSSAPSTSAPASSAAPSTASTASEQTGSQQATATNQQTQGQNNNADPNSKPQTPAEKKYLSEEYLDSWTKLKVGGEEKEMTVREALKIQQLEQASRQKMQEAAQAMKTVKEVEAFVAQALKDPTLFFKEFGLNAEEFAENILAQKYQLAQMSPAERELHELKQWKAQQDNLALQSKSQVINEIKEFLGKDAPQDLDKYSKEDLQVFLEREKGAIKSAEQSIEQDFVKTWPETGLPKHQKFMQWVAQEQIRALKNNQDLPIKDAANKVKSDFTAFVGQIFKDMSPDMIQQALGEDTMKRLRQFAVEQVSQGTMQNQQTQRPGNQSASEPKKYLNQLEWRKHMGI